MYYSQEVQDVLSHFSVTAEGLSQRVAKERLTKHGPNALKNVGEKISRFHIFMNQWKSPLILILLVAGTVSGLLGETVDMTIIFITAGINGLIGFFQEDKANQALSKLRSLVTYKALVSRGAHKVQISSDDIVPGDVVYLNAGDKVQADGRLISVSSLQVNEAALTGESQAVAKTIATLKEDTSLADRTNMVYRGTMIAAGEGVMVVTATGHETELGKISTLVQETTDDQTPLQQQLSKLSRVLGVIVVSFAVLIVVLGYVFGKNTYHLLELFETAVAVAVAAIPEGLAISLTVILAIGMQHILRRKALVRKLVAAETLGSVSVICTDKTGTLTEGNMQVTRILVGNNHVDVGAKGWKTEAVLEALRIGTICNDALHANPEESKKKWKFFGDTTETAILAAAADAGLMQQSLHEQYERRASIAFDSDRKYMATHNRSAKGSFVFVKGAPEVLLERATQYRVGKQKRELTKKQRDLFAEQQASLSSARLRVLAVAYRETDNHEVLTDAAVTNLVFVGFVGIADPLRSDVASTIAAAKHAGIHVVMITGDHAGTAQAIARQIGLPHDIDHVLEGAALEGMSDAELSGAIKRIHIFARVDPKHKIRIVRAFQHNDEVVAMTGDGINDAPALKGADIGVALGSGTDVAKEVSDMVLLDNSFSTIVAAVEEGRRMYQNIKKEVTYLLSGSMTAVVLIAGSLVAGLPLAILPAQILWMNIVQEAFPTMALAFDPGDKDNMFDKPRKKHTPIFDHKMKTLLVTITIVSNVALFGLFIYFLKTTGDIARVRTLMFIGLGIDALLYIYSIRSMRYHVWRMNAFNNWYLNGAVVLGWILLIAAVYAPPLQTLLRTVPIDFTEWIIMLCFALSSVVVVELIKSLYAVKTQYKSS